MPEAGVEPGSFRDRSARVFIQDDEVFRGLNERALEQWNTLSATAFFRRFVADGGLVGTERLDPAERALPAFAADWAAVLRHERIPFVSYPYEWSFGMLRDAALLQLDLLLAALDEGMTLKDASAYNVQWRGAKPVFVDVASFERRPPGEPWIGYRQFCQLFLYRCCSPRTATSRSIPGCAAASKGSTPRAASTRSVSAGGCGAACCRTCTCRRGHRPPTAARGGTSRPTSAPQASTAR